MTEFDTLTDEELAQLESLYFSPTWKAVAKVCNGRTEILKNEAYTQLLIGNPDIASELSHRADEYQRLQEVMDQRLNPPKELEAPQTNPKTFHELLP